MTSAAPELSVIVPTRNRRRLLRECLDSLALQTASPDSFEVVVVDDGSEDGTGAQLGKLEPPHRLLVLRLDHSGAAAARNHGLAHASGRSCLFLDDDMQAVPGLVAAHAAAQRAGDGAVVLGRIGRVARPGAGRLDRFRAEELETHYAELENGRPPGWMDCYGGNFSAPRAVLEDVGGFRPELDVMHDVELGFRLGARGLPFVFEPAAAALETAHETLGELADGAERRGAASVFLVEGEPRLIEQLKLGGRAGENLRSAVAGRVLDALRIRSRAVAAVVRAVPSERLARRGIRFLESYAYWRGVRRSTPDAGTWRSLRHGTPILMYHAIGGVHEPPSRWVVPQDRFRRQVGWLARNGYTAITLEELVRYRAEHRLPPAKAVVLTFDDGYADFVERALPVLDQFDFPATVFLVTATGGMKTWHVGGGNGDGRRLLTLQDASRLKDRIDFGAHTRTHPSLPSLDPDDVAAEVAGSKRELESVIGGPVASFAYPYGDVNDEVAEAVRSAGFLAACSTDDGSTLPADDPFALPRIEVRGTDTLPRFAATLWAGRRLPDRSPP
ncbi:MAG TPA: glycosyltransferase [Gaiellaceae bacterium]|nr:glycosyltransferase [Gaiellaceae bacterium]